jgi:hypothetical protein
MALNNIRKTFRNFKATSLNQLSMISNAVLVILFEPFSLVKAGIYRRSAPIDAGLSLFEHSWTPFDITASGLIKTRPIRTQRQG